MVATDHDAAVFCYRAVTFITVLSILTFKSTVITEVLWLQFSLASQSVSTTHSISSQKVWATF